MEEDHPGIFTLLKWLVPLSVGALVWYVTTMIAPLSTAVAELRSMALTTIADQARDEVFQSQTARRLGQLERSARRDHDELSRLKAAFDEMRYKRVNGCFGTKNCGGLAGSAGPVTVSTEGMTDD